MGPRIILRIKTCRWASLPQSRSFSASCVGNSGHNRWSKIKHDKGAADARKSKERTKLAYEVFLASKYGGGNTQFNTRLVNAITNAKRGSLDKAAIETAIARGQGKSASGAALEDVTVEAMLPFGVATVLEYSTDQKARVLQEIRSIIKRAGGTVTPTSFMFEKKGRIWFERKQDVSVDDVLDEAIEAGAMDVEEEDGQLVVDTDPKDTTFLTQRLCEKYGLTLERSEILYDPKEELMVELQDEQSTELGTIIDSIEEDPGLQNIYLNVAG